MNSKFQGLYVSADELQSWRSRLEKLTSELQALVHDVGSAECIDIRVHKVAPTPAAKPRRSRAKSVTEQDITDARVRLEQSIELDKQRDAAMARSSDPLEDREAASQAAPETAVQTDEPIATVQVSPEPIPEPPPKPKGANAGVPRQRFGKLRQQLVVDHGPEVAAHMVSMCGDDKRTITLRRHVQRFIGTYPDARAAQLGFCRAMGVVNPEELAADDVLSNLSDVLQHSDNTVSVWANEGDEEQLRRVRRLNEGVDEEPLAEDTDGQA